MVLVIRKLPANAGDTETLVRSLGWKDPLEERTATNSSIVAWRIPWAEEPGRLQSMGSQESDTTERLSTALKEVRGQPEISGGRTFQEKRPASAKTQRQGWGLAPSRSSRGPRSLVGGQSGTWNVTRQMAGVRPQSSFYSGETRGLGGF